MLIVLFFPSASRTRVAAPGPLAGSCIPLGILMGGTSWEALRCFQQERNQKWLDISRSLFYQAWLGKHWKWEQRLDRLQQPKVPLVPQRAENWTGGLEITLQSKIPNSGLNQSEKKKLKQTAKPNQKPTLRDDRETRQTFCWCLNMIQSGLFPQVASGSSASWEVLGAAAAPGACGTCRISLMAAKNNSFRVLN